ncbi:MAG UNVERIFIED_CONTAM: hypothetical protein LVT10_14010 [Anaerolineae bacterium]|jgi:hypothetical protein
MLLSDYQWSGNPRGLHITNAFVFDQDVNHYARLRLGWLKLVCGGDEFLHLVAPIASAQHHPDCAHVPIELGQPPAELDTFGRLILTMPRRGSSGLSSTTNPIKA